MVKGLYISATSLNANKKKLEVISNNLSNIETTGFKKDDLELESFNARLLKRINGSLRPSELGGFGASSEKLGDEFEISTQKGLFVFETDNGFHFSKAGRVVVDSDGYVRSVYRLQDRKFNEKLGSYLLSGNERVKLEPGSEFSITENGMLTSDSGSFRVVSNLRNTDVGTISAGVKSYAVRTNFEQGNIVRTDNKTDFAIQGEGFFEVIGGDGKDYLTRFGAFTLTNSNELVTLDGSKLKGLKGPIKLEPGDFAINNFGEIIQKGEIVDKLSMCNFSNKDDIYKVGNYFFKEKKELSGKKLQFEGQVIQGHIEKSNVDAVTEMIKMIELNRNYESSQKVVNTIDEMLGKASNDLGRV